MAQSGSALNYFMTGSRSQDDDDKKTMRKMGRANVDRVNRQMRYTAMREDSVREGRKRDSKRAAKRLSIRSSARRQTR